MSDFHISSLASNWILISHYWYLWNKLWHLQLLSIILFDWWQDHSNHHFAKQRIKSQSYFLWKSLLERLRSFQSLDSKFIWRNHWHSIIDFVHSLPYSYLNIKGDHYDECSQSTFVNITDTTLSSNINHLHLIFYEPISGT
jgi:hypothetical protein